MFKDSKWKSIIDLQLSERDTFDYIMWMHNVKQRDNNKCIICGDDLDIEVQNAGGKAAWLDKAYDDAYDIEQELRSKYKDINLVVLIASVRDKNKIDDIFNILREEKISCIMVTHDISDAITFSDRILILQEKPSIIKKEIITNMTEIPSKRVYEKEYLKLLKEVDDNV